MKISDGLGNQLFQYAIGRMLSFKMSVPLKLDLSWFRNVGIRPYLLPKFSMPLQEASAQEIRRVKEAYYFKEKHFHFSAAAFNLPKEVYLEGYWQSEKYFSEISSMLRRELQISSEPSFANQLMARKIARCDSVAVHVRRGDYVDHPATNAVHGVCGMDYYHRAMELIRSKVGSPHFFIFSDDWNWVAEQFNWLNAGTVVTVNLPGQGHEDLRLMSLCRHHIIANSTLSWWGAWLGDWPEQNVIAPKRWFNQAKMSTHDLFPDDWTLI